MYGKKILQSNWKDIKIKQDKGNLDNITVDAGNQYRSKM